jgi:dihydroneopterin aldolase
VDLVSVRDLSVPAVIGVHDWERDITQTLVFSVDLAADVRTRGPSSRSSRTAGSGSSRPPPSGSPTGC